MPSKKSRRSRNKKNKKGKQQTKNSSLTTDVNVPEEAVIPHVSPDTTSEDIATLGSRKLSCIDVLRLRGGLKSFMQAGGKPTFRKLTKHLPEVVLDLRSGRYDPDKLASDLADLLTKLSGEHYCIDPCFRILCLAWPESPTTSKGVGLELLRAFRVKFYERFEENWKGPCFEDDRMRITLKDAFENTCRLFLKQVETLYYNGVDGAFHDACPLLGLDVVGWMEMTHNTHAEYSKHMHMFLDFSLATQVIAGGYDLVSDHCWECGKSPGSYVQVCSQCNTAQFCGRQCQKAAWSRGHRNMCNTLGRAKKAMMEMLDHIYSLNATGTMINGLYPKKHSFFTLMYMIVSCIVNGHELVIDDCDGPKFDHLYHNLAAVQEGKWWIVSNPSSEEEFWEAAGGDGLVLIQCACVTLCYDLEGKARRHILGKTKSKAVEAPATVELDSEAIQAILPPGLDSVFSCKGGSVVMPPSALLKEFLQRQPSISGPKEVARVRKLQEARGSTLLRNAMYEGNYNQCE